MALGEPTELLAAYKAALESGATQSSGSSALAIDASKKAMDPSSAALSDL